MPVIKYPSGAEVSTFDPPPPGFDPLRADAAELLRHGFPPWPGNGPEMPSYEAVMRRLQGRLHYIVPTFRRREEVRPRPMQPDANTETLPNWSGAVQFASEGRYIIFVEGSWTVPNTYAPAGDGIYTCSTWVGIDGGSALSSDLCQVGVESAIYRTPWFSVRETYAWWEWWPEFQIQVTNFPITEGDEIYCNIWGAKHGSTTASVIMASSGGAATSFMIQAPHGYQLYGDTAEWIVERVQVGGLLTNLANYGTVFFSNADAYDDRPQVLGAGYGNPVQMTDDMGNVISVGILWDPTIVQCLYTGDTQPQQ
jgi:hypothetical protein